MINLMPDEAKKQLRAARVNTLLIRYTLVILAACSFIALLLGGSIFVLSQNETSANQLIASNDTKAQEYTTTEQEINSLSSNLSGARVILDQQLLYSKALRTISQNMLPGTVFESLTLDDTTMNGAPVSVKVYATSQELITQLGENLKRTGQFSEASAQSINEQSGIDGYPVSATMTLIMNRGVAQ